MYHQLGIVVIAILIPTVFITKSDDNPVPQDGAPCEDFQRYFHNMLFEDELKGKYIEKYRVCENL